MSMMAVLFDRMISDKGKGKSYRSVVRSNMLYGSEKLSISGDCRSVLVLVWF